MSLAMDILRLKAEQNGLTLHLPAYEDGADLVRKIDGRKHRLRIDELWFAALGAPDNEGAFDRLQEKIDLFVWSTDRPRGVVAGYCGTPRFLGRRCAI